MSSQHIGYGTTASGKINTTTATTTTVCSFDVTTLAGFNANNCSFFCKGLLVAQSSGGNALEYEMYALFKRVAGTITQVGATTLLTSLVDAALNATSYVLDFTGTTIRLRAVSIAATIDWTGVLQMTSSPF